MKILFISNNEDYDPKKNPRGDILLLHLYEKKGNEVLKLRKQDWLGFYFSYMKFKPDIILSSWVPGGFIPTILKRIGLINVPLVHHWDDFYEDSMTNYPKFLISFLEKSTIKNSDYIITVSKYNEKKAKDMNKKVFYVAHGIDENVKETEINLDSLKTDNDNLKVVYIGDQFSKYKALDKIIVSVSRLKCDLFLFGEINKKLIPLGGKNVHFMGKVPSSEILSILKQSDILINRSNMDSNFKFFEYIHAGKPILAHNDRPSLLFKHRYDAFLTDNFEEGLSILIEDAELRKRLEENVKKIKTYSWDSVADMHLELYDKMINDG